MKDTYDDSTSELLDRAIDAVRESAPPAESCDRVIEQACSWNSRSTTETAHPRVKAAGRALVACVALAVLAPGLWLSFVAMTPSSPGSATPLDPAGRSQGPAPLSFMAPGGGGHSMVAEIAPVVAGLGPEQPTELGMEIPHARFRDNLDARLARLHLWDWSRGRLSRVLVVERSDLGVLSADGRTMVSRDGKSVDLESGKVTQIAGFAVEEGQHVTDMGISPGGRFAWLMIHVRTRVDRVPGKPGVSGATHFWHVRVVDLKEGKVVGEFRAKATGGCAFTSDERSFVYSDDNNAISCRSVANGELIRRYSPSVAGHGAVGIAVSADGRFVAAGQYHGKLYIWELASGRKVLESQFKRDDGKDDVFFQAKLMRFSDDGERLAVASGSRLKVLETGTGRVLGRHYDPTTPVFVHVRWSDEPGKLLLVAPSIPAQFRGVGFRQTSAATRLPQIYEWNWQSDKLTVYDMPE